MDLLHTCVRYAIQARKQTLDAYFPKRHERLEKKIHFLIGLDLKLKDFGKIDDLEITKC